MHRGTNYEHRGTHHEHRCARRNHSSTDLPARLYVLETQALREHYNAYPKMERE